MLTADFLVVGVLVVGVLVVGVTGFLVVGVTGFLVVGVLVVGVLVVGVLVVGVLVFGVLVVGVLGLAVVAGGRVTAGWVTTGPPGGGAALELGAPGATVGATLGAAPTAVLGAAGGPVLVAVPGAVLGATPGAPPGVEPAASVEPGDAVVSEVGTVVGLWIVGSGFSITGAAGLLGLARTTAREVDTAAWRRAVVATEESGSGARVTNVRCCRVVVVSLRKSASETMPSFVWTLIVPRAVQI